MTLLEEAIAKKNKIGVWGCGNYLSEAIKKIDPSINLDFACDKDKNKWGKVFTDRGLVCCSPEAVRNMPDALVIIAIKNKKIANELKEQLLLDGISCIHINDAVREYRMRYESILIDAYNRSFDKITEPDDKEVLKYFISISVPVSICQLKCSYCYIGQHGGFVQEDISLPSAKFIRCALSRKRIGGTALINFCGVGETLLCEELFDIVHELLLEGHYISIITNALLKEKIQRFAELPLELREKIFFKCSFHYLQLKEKNLLTIFADNVDMIRNAGMSMTVELVPEDKLVPLIEEIKKFAMKRFGALPHVTVARNENDENMPIISNYCEEEYWNIWRCFGSAMFEEKMRQRVKRSEYCLAGKNSFLISLESGEAYPCPYMEKIGNVYDYIAEKIDFKAVGCNCTRPYCINNHAYIALGMLKDVNECSYLEIRDRIDDTGEHWVKNKVAKIYSQRICDNVF